MAKRHKPNGRGINWRKGLKGSTLAPGQKITQLDDQEKAMILRLSEQGKSVNSIAKALDRHASSVSRYLAKFRDTTPEARAFIKSKALLLAKRVVEKADVAQAMDILSRPGVDVLAPPAPKVAGPQNGFTINVVQGSLGAVAGPKPVGESHVRNQHQLPGVQGGGLQGSRPDVVDVVEATGSPASGSQEGNAG